MESQAAGRSWIWKGAHKQKGVYWPTFFFPRGRRACEKLVWSHIRVPSPSYLHHDQNLRYPRRDGGRGNRQPVGRPGVEERGFCGRSCWAISPMGIGNAVGAEHADLDHGTSGDRVAIRGRSPGRVEHEAGRGREGACLVCGFILCRWYVRKLMYVCTSSAGSCVRSKANIRKRFFSVPPQHTSCSHMATPDHECGLKIVS